MTIILRKPGQSNRSDIVHKGDVITHLEMDNNFEHLVSVDDSLAGRVSALEGGVPAPTLSSIYESAVNSISGQLLWDITFPAGTVLPSSDFDKIIQIRNTTGNNTTPAVFTLEDGTTAGQTVKILVNPVIATDPTQYTQSPYCRVWAKQFIENYARQDGNGSQYGFVNYQSLTGYKAWSLIWTGDYWAKIDG